MITRLASRLAANTGCIYEVVGLHMIPGNLPVCVCVCVCVCLMCVLPSLSGRLLGLREEPGRRSTCSTSLTPMVKDTITCVCLCVCVFGSVGVCVSVCSRVCFCV